MNKAVQLVDMKFICKLMRGALMSDWGPPQMTGGGLESWDSLYGCQRLIAQQWGSTIYVT